MPVDAVDLVDLHDVAMHEPGGSPGFLREAEHSGTGRAAVSWRSTLTATARDSDACSAR